MNYTLCANGVPVPLYETTVYPPPYNQFVKMPFAILPTDQPVDFEITSEIPIEDVTIRPLRLGIQCTHTRHSIQFHMETPEKISVEINGSYKNNLVILASQPRTEDFSQESSNLLRYPCGEYKENLQITTDHTILYLESGAQLEGKIQISDCRDITIFVDKDAILYAKLTIENCTNVKICGFGSICGERFARHLPEYLYLIEARFCKNLVIRDVSLLDSSCWTCRIFGCDDIHVDNINIFGCRGNSDGVDICGSRNALVEHCFIRTWDDCFVAKAFDTGNLEHVVFRDSTLWNDFARPLEVGVELRADSVQNITFENIDIIHSVTGYPTMGIHHGDRGKLRNITFSNIRIEDAPGGQIFDIRMTNSVWNEDSSIGDIDGLKIEDIYLYDGQKILPSRSRLEGYSPESNIRNVTLKNICFGGKYATTLEECHVNIMDFVENVSVEFPHDAPKLNAVHTAVSVAEPFRLEKDGFYHGVVEVILENRNSTSVSGSARLQISPRNMVNLENDTTSYMLSSQEKIAKQYPLSLQPGKYVFAVQSADPSMEASWCYEELPLPLPASLEQAAAYSIVNYYGDAVHDVKLAVHDNTLLIQSDALRENTFTVYSAEPAIPAPGEVKFTVEETDFGEAVAIMDGKHGLEEAPQLRCPAEITYVFKNEPKVKKIYRNTLGNAGSDTISLSFETLGIPLGAQEFWLEIVADLPEVKQYRYAFSMFHSVRPAELAHMFARAYLQE